MHFTHRPSSRRRLKTPRGGLCDPSEHWERIKLPITHNSDLNDHQWRQGLPEERLDSRAREVDCLFRETESEDL
jgi:hypothetical protein